MDKFNKVAITLLVIAVTALVIMAYVSYQVGGNAATDDTVNAKAGSNGNTYYNPFTIEHWGVPGENVGFTVVGIAGGLIGGYMYPTVFAKTQTGRKEQK